MDMISNKLGVRVLSPRPRLAALPQGVLSLLAPAKINLNLLVGRRRADGYHSVDSFVCRVSLYDQIELAPRQDGQITIACFGADCGSNDKNLALGAAKLLAARCSQLGGIVAAGGVSISLHKRIPPGKGLGGGSSDAASVLAALNELWALGLAGEQLARLGSQLGSDVPLFLGPPSARITGRGEHVAPLTAPPFWAILFLPDFFCQTADVYQAYDRQDISIEQQLDPGALAGPPSQWRHKLKNHLLPAAAAICPGLGDYQQQAQQALGIPVCLTGSGSAMFVLCDNQDEAISLAAKLPQELQEDCVIVQNNPW
jgi:4-diphosphocytidyl-2-C-methyl-D-erythritol kinase